MILLHLSIVIFRNISIQYNKYKYLPNSLLWQELNAPNFITKRISEHFEQLMTCENSIDNSLLKLWQLANE